MLPILIWWLLLEILGLAALPVAFRLFRSLPDRGYAFARPLGLLLTSYALWLLVTFGVLDNTWGAGVLIVLGLAAAAWLLARAQIADLLGFLRQNLRLIALYEVLFLGAFALWALFKAYNPEISATEKPMDFAFLNAIFRSQHFPPADPWLSGYSISYYYFGYLMMATLTKLSGLATSITFNLSIALVFALTITGAFSVVFNLVVSNQGISDEETKKRVNGGTRGQGPSSSLIPHPSSPVPRPSALIFGLLGAFFVAVAGNLEGLLDVLHTRGLGSPAFWTWLNLQEMLPHAVTGGWLPRDNWWWWAASRVVSGEIDEFPFFSFLLADLHPHVMALPFVLMALGLAVNVLLDRRESDSRPSISLIADFLRTWPSLLLPALLLGALGFLNSWDFPTYSVVVIGAFAIQRYREQRRLNLSWLKSVGLYAVALVALGFILYLPFYVNFSSQAGGIRPVLLDKTQLRQFLVQFGLFIYVAAGFLAVQGAAWLAARNRALPLRPGIGSLAITLVVGAVVLLFLLIGWWTSALLVAFIAMAAALLWQRLRTPGDTVTAAELFVLLSIAIALGLTLICEFAYIRDIYGSRLNTVFKLYYQAWVLLSIAAAYGVYRLAQRPASGSTLGNSLRAIWGVGFLALLLAASIYPVWATYTKANEFRGPPTLDGIDALRRYQADEAAAIQWLNANVPVPGTPVLVEAPGEEWSEYGRISMHTGLPALLGWKTHEVQWRGRWEKGQLVSREADARVPDIDTIYKTLDQDVAQRLLQKYDVTYVYVGRLERDHYRDAPAGALDKFAKFMDVAYKNPTVTIYKVR
jgi:YYY domain-containing protein